MERYTSRPPIAAAEDARALRVRVQGTERLLWYDLLVVDIQELLTRPDALHARIRAALDGRGRTLSALPAGLRRAAVLVTVVQQGGEAALLLTKRSDTVERHKGQISLPGGVIKPGESPRAAAIRETHEEIGVRARDITILGALDEEETVVSGFVLTPFVGTIPYPYPLRVCPAEVDTVLEVPIRTLLDPRTVRTETWDRQGFPRLIYFYTVGSEVVWGATARVITQFLEVVFNVALARDAGGPVARRAK